MKKIWVLGVGPGAPEYVAPVIWEKAKHCEILLGGKRNLALFPDFDGEKIVLDADPGKFLNKIKELRKDRQIGVLVSGDPGFYSMLKVLREHFSRSDLEVYPGISSLQYLFAKGALTWQDAVLISLHGRRDNRLPDLVRNNSQVALLTDARYPVGEIARFLVENGVEGKRALVGENLSYPEEKVRDMPLEKWIGVEVSPLTVMVIYNE